MPKHLNYFMSFFRNVNTILCLAFREGQTESDKTVIIYLSNKKIPALKSDFLSCLSLNNISKSIYHLIIDQTYLTTKGENNEKNGSVYI